MEIELRDYTIERAKVTLPGKVKPGEERPYIMVRGICGDDIVYLVMSHHADITKALVIYQEQRERIMKGGQGLTNFILALARDFPDVIAEVISAACDKAGDEATLKVAKQLPIPTQLLALNEIIRLTMEDAGGLKNLLAEMRERLQDAAAVGAK
jgi:hypothetical protein